MSIPVAKGTPVSRAGRLIVQILPGHRLLREKGLFGPGAGGKNRRSQPSNPPPSSDGECWAQRGGTARHYSRRLQQLVLGRLVNPPAQSVVTPNHAILTRARGGLGRREMALKGALILRRASTEPVLWLMKRRRFL